MTPQELRRSFNSSWPLIGVIHLLPLPGSPMYQGDFGDVLARAEEDARAYEQAGFDAVIVENFGDRPFYPVQVEPETIAGMAVVAWKVRNAVKLPLGLNVLRNDARTALGIAATVEAAFIRVNVHTGVMVTDQGLIEGRAWETLRVRQQLATPVRIFADVHVKHGSPLARQDIAEAAHETVERGLADAVILTGSATGRKASVRELIAVREVLPDVAILVGSGVSVADLADLIGLADGAIVGTSVKRGGVTMEPVDVLRAKELAAKRDELIGSKKKR